MAIVKVLNGQTGAQAAQTLYDNDIANRDAAATAQTAATAAQTTGTDAQTKVNALNAAIVIDATGNVLFVDALGNIGFIITPTGVIKMGDAQIRTLTVNGVPIDPTTYASQAQVTVLTAQVTILNTLLDAIKTADLTNQFVVQDANNNIGFRIDSLGNMRAGNTRLKSISNESGNSLKPIKFKNGDVADIIHLMSYGQSNSVGSGGTTVITTVQKYDSLMFVGGLRQNTVSTGNFSSLVPLVEAAEAGLYGETPISGLSDFLIESILRENYMRYTGKQFVILGSAPGVAGKGIDELSKGGLYYPGLVNHVRQGFTRAQALNKTYNVPCVYWTQGEHEISVNPMTTAQYNTYLNQLINDCNTDFPAITAQANAIPFIGYQVNVNANLDPDRISKAHLYNGLYNPLFVCATPSYFFDIEAADNVHFSAKYDRIYGAYLALATKRHLIDGPSKFKPVHPTCFYWSGTTLEVTYHVPVGPLMFDTSDVSDPGNFGFLIKDVGGAVIAISNVRITGGNKVLIDCASSPLNGTFTYARQATGSNYVTADPLYVRFAARGCLRDNQGEFIKFDADNDGIAEYPMHNYCAAIWSNIQQNKGLIF